MYKITKVMVISFITNAFLSLVKIIFGLKIKEEPKTQSKVAFITTEYNFKNIFSLKTKQRIPANKKSAELSIGRQSSAFFSESASDLRLPVALKKKAQAKTTTHNDKTLTGILNTTNIVNINTG